MRHVCKCGLEFKERMELAEHVTQFNPLTYPINPEHAHSINDEVNRELFTFRYQPKWHEPGYVKK